MFQMHKRQLKEISVEGVSMECQNEYLFNIQFPILKEI